MKSSICLKSCFYNLFGFTIIGKNCINEMPARKVSSLVRNGVTVNWSLWGEQDSKRHQGPSQGANGKNGRNCLHGKNGSNDLNGKNGRHCKNR